MSVITVADSWTHAEQAADQAGGAYIQAVGDQFFVKDVRTTDADIFMPANQPAPVLYGEYESESEAISVAMSIGGGFLTHDVGGFLDNESWDVSDRRVDETSQYVDQFGVITLLGPGESGPSEMYEPIEPEPEPEPDLYIPPDTGPVVEEAPKSGGVGKVVAAVAVALGAMFFLGRK